MKPLVLACALACLAQGADRAACTRPTTPPVCERCIRAHEEFLASDALNGRGSETRDEWIAATYVASELRAYGIEPAGDDGGYIQRATIVQAPLAGAPVLTVTAPGAKPVSWTHGKEFFARVLAEGTFGGELRQLSAAEARAFAAGSLHGQIVLLSSGQGDDRRAAIGALVAAGARAIMLPRADTSHWHEGPPFPELAAHFQDGSPVNPEREINLLEVSENAAAELRSLPPGTQLHLEAPASASQESHTWNAVGMIRGRDAALRSSALLLSAHLDHLGVGEPVKGDSIYNGADDDASGTTAVLELARVLVQLRPRRTIVFALFGSEEVGGIGSRWFREHPPVPLASIAANLEFEMIGDADPAVAPGRLWLTGWERSNLGPALAAHGARLVADPHPAEHFFERSDNFVLAKKGVVAQTISSYGLHARYHQPDDDVRHINFAHMAQAVRSLLGAIQWLANSNFVPRWNPGGRP